MPSPTVSGFSVARANAAVRTGNDWRPTEVSTATFGTHPDRWGINLPSFSDRTPFSKPSQTRNFGLGRFQPLHLSDTLDAAGDFQNWPNHDLAFAANQLLQEYPKVQRDRVTKAVNSAAPFVPIAEGRVGLMRRARVFLRQSD
jgi:hypothetical protein